MNEITKKNENWKEIGQIISSINNVYSICCSQDNRKGQKKNMLNDVTEKTPEIIAELVKRLERSSEVIEDLVAIQDLDKQIPDRD